MSDIVIAYAPENAAANLLAGAKWMVGFVNEQRKAGYVRAFQNWAANVEAGRITNADPPKVPNAVKLDAPDEFGFVYGYIEDPDTPVCAPLPVPEDHLTPPPPPVPMTIDVGVSADQGAGHWFTVGAMDAYPPGKTTPPGTTSRDGVTGTFLRVPHAFGKGWYEKVG